MTRYFTFIGVTTGQSSIVKIFPRWRDELQLGDDVELRGEDLPLHASANDYWAVVKRIKYESDQVGALVTTHKIDLYNAAGSLFDQIDQLGRLCGEVSCIARRGDRLLGWAKDPIAAGRALDRLLAPGHFGRTGAEVLCLGSGGAGLAIGLCLLTRDDRPGRLTLTDRDASRLRHADEILATLGSDVTVEYVCNEDADALLGNLPPHSLVINATGMGKDLPGSPISDDAKFPLGAVAWDLNYRGQLTFLRQAHRQESEAVRPVDGWDYFIYGWTAVMEEVFERPISENELERLSDLATFARPGVS